MIYRKRTHRIEEYINIYIKWSLLGCLMGVIGGLLGTVFHHALAFVSDLRHANGWLILLLPVGGLLSVAIYRLFRQEKNRGTNEIIDDVLQDKPVSPLVAPTIFLATAVTHLFGGSAGREGAALQLGGSAGSLVSKLFKQENADRTGLIMCGMSAVFAGLFGTPLTACIFVVEFTAVGTIFNPALLPCYASALVASQISAELGVHAETFDLTHVIPLTLDTGWRIVVLSMLTAVLGAIMCRVFHNAEHLAVKHLKNPWIRIACGGAVVSLMTILAADQRFNGAGMDMAFAALEGHADWYSFLVKMLFTAVTLAAGFKGGEIVPTFCIGATFGCVVGSLLGLDPSVAAAMGLVGLFCTGTNAPLASIFLSIEMFGISNLKLFALTSVIVFLMSGHSSLYGSQRFRFDKTAM